MRFLKRSMNKNRLNCVSRRMYLVYGDTENFETIKRRDSNMNSIYYDKLVRDKIPDVIRKAGKLPITDIMSQDDMTAALNRKLLEEAQEYIESGSVEEMADVLEVLHGIAFHKGITWDEVESARIYKHEERGGFEKGIRLLEVREP